MADSLDFSSLPDLPRGGKPTADELDFSTLPDLPPTRNQDEDLSAPIRLASALGSGAATSVAALPGMLGSLQSAVERGGDYLREKGYLPPVPKESIFRKKFPTMDETVAATRKAVGGPTPNVFDFVPQNKAEEYAYTVGGFLPGAGRNVLTMGVLPALTSETAGQITRGTELEPWARGAAALATGGAGAIAVRPSVAERTIAEAVRGMTRPQVLAMETLMRDAQAAGLPLTRAEAAQAATGGATRLSDIQRVVEGQGGLREMMAQRPAQVEAVGREAIGRIAPPSAQPSTIGPQVSEAARGTIEDVQAAINRHTRPLYQAAEPQTVGPAAAQLAAAEPIYAQTLQEVRGNPALNRAIANLPDDSPVVMDLVRQRLRERAQGAASIGQATPSNLEAASYGAVERQAGQRSTAASPELAQARAQQAHMREQYLAPLQAGPLGKLMDTPETRRAIKALFPRDPVPGSAGEVLDAVTALSARSPLATRQLVRAHVESVFNTATRDLQAGPSGFGGASFRAQLVGNAQQAENMAAAIRGLPGGAAILPGFDRMLEIMEATGQRQRIGSQTAFNAEMQAALKSGGMLGEAATLAAGVGTQFPKRVLERFKQWNLGRNTDELARLLTDPRATGLFRTLAEAPQGSSRAYAAAARLGALGMRSTDDRATRRKNEAIRGEVTFAP